MDEEDAVLHTNSDNDFNEGLFATNILGDEDSMEIMPSNVENEIVSEKRNEWDESQLSPPHGSRRKKKKKKNRSVWKQYQEIEKGGMDQRRRKKKSKIYSPK